MADLNTSSTSNLSAQNYSPSASPDSQHTFQAATPSGTNTTTTTTVPLSTNTDEKAQGIDAELKKLQEELLNMDHYTEEDISNLESKFGASLGDLSSSKRENPKSFEEELEEIDIEKEKLELERTRLEEEGRYLEAHECTLRMKELSLRGSKRIKDEIEHTHKRREKELKAKNHEEIDQFEKIWEKKLQAFDAQAKELLAQTLVRQRCEKRDAENHLRAQFRIRKPKFSTVVLSMRRSLETLVKQRLYDEAEKLRIKLRPVEVKEMENFENEQIKLLENKMKQLDKVQKQEIGALKKKIKQGQEELLMQKQKEEQQLEKRQVNLEKSLEIEQKRNMAKTKNLLQRQVKVILTSPTKSHTFQIVG